MVDKNPTIIGPNITSNTSGNPFNIFKIVLIAE